MVLLSAQMSRHVALSALTAVRGPKGRVTVFVTHMSSACLVCHGHVIDTETVG